jgi:hypothetical protein
MKKTLYFLAMVLLSAGIFALRARPKLDARRFVSGIPTITPDLKLTVATMDLIKNASGESPKIAWGVDWGTTKAVVSVPARIHYAIDLSGPEPVAFSQDKATGMLSATFPDPQVQAVELFSGRKQAVIEPGWGRLQALSGQALVDALDRGMYDAVKVDAADPRALEQVSERSRPELKELVADYVAKMGSRPRGIVIRFKSEAEPILQASR